MPALTAPVQLSPHLHILYSEYPHVDSGNVYLLTGKHPTLIDCGSPRSIPGLLGNLSQVGLSVRDLQQVIATHGDYDHTQGFHELHRLHPGLRLHLHRHDWPAVQDIDEYRSCSYLYGRAVEPLAADQCHDLADGQVIVAGDTRLVVCHTPGHTEGSVCLAGDVDGNQVLFAGDVFGGAMKRIEGADPVLWVQAIMTWRQSLQRISGLQFDWILNGHEPAASLPLSRAYFDRRVKTFGHMLNPWFALGEDEPIPERTSARIG